MCTGTNPTKPSSEKGKWTRGHLLGRGKSVFSKRMPEGMSPQNGLVVFCVLFVSFYFVLLLLIWFCFVLFLSYWFSFVCLFVCFDCKICYFRERKTKLGEIGREKNRFKIHWKTKIQ